MDLFDDVWLSDYLKKHSYLAPRMAEGATSGAVPPGSPVPSAGPGGDPDEPEGVLLAKVRRCALDNGFVFYHTHDSRRSDVGYLDCTLTKPGHPLYVWELKTRTGQASMEQLRWLAFLRQATHIEAALYRPSDWETMHALLTRRSS